LEIRGGPEWAAKQKAFRQVVATTGSALLERELDFVSRSEGGQAESWLLVASPCGTLAEQADESGLRALTVASLARGLSGKSRVSLEPWITTNAIGLLAHAPPLRGETPDHHAARIARVLGQALAGPPLDGRDVAAVRSEHLALIGRGPGEDLMLRVLAGEVPSFLSPLGLEADLATMSVADVQRMRAALLREPLRAAFIASGTRSQAEAAQAALSAWLAPHRGA